MENQEIHKEKCTKCTELIKVNKELKTLLVGALGGEIASSTEKLVNENVLLAQELEEIKRRILKGTDDIDNLSAQADTWRSKYMALKISQKDLITWKNTTLRLLEDLQTTASSILQEYDKMWASQACTFSTLQTFCKQKQVDLSYITEGPIHANLLQLGEMNQKLSRNLLSSLGKNGFSLNENLPISEPTSSVKKAISLVSIINVLIGLQSSSKSSPAAHGFIERFHPACSHPDYDGPIFCHGCKGKLKIV